MDRYFIVLNAKVIKIYKRKSLALAKFESLSKSIDPEKDILELWRKYGYFIKPLKKD